MTQEEKLAIAKEIGEQATQRVSDALKAVQAEANKFAAEALKAGGFVSDETVKAYNATFEDAVKEVKEIQKAQGVTIQGILEKGVNAENSKKSLSELMHEDKNELEQIRRNGVGNKEYMLTLDKSGNYTASRVEKTSTMATIDGLGGAGNTASIISALSASQVIRLAGPGTGVIGQFRNRPWVFDLCNTTTVNPAQMLAYYIEELAPSGAPAFVPEGDIKPLVKSNYRFRAESWRKFAMLLNFTEEFGQMDFGYLEQDATQRGVIDVINGINSDVLTRVISNATVFSQSAAQFTAPTPKNKWHVIAAMASQAERATFGGAMASAAVMGTGSKYEFGTQVATDGQFLNSPQVLQNIGIVSNPVMPADSILVGDFSQYNIQLRGGMIVRTGYNGTDFAENKYSTVVEQPYFDWISPNRVGAIVNGPDFATVLAAI